MEQQLIPHVPTQPGTTSELLADVLHRYKLTGSGLAKVLHISQPQLSAMLSGKRKLSVKVARRLYLGLGVDPVLILSIKDDEYSHKILTQEEYIERLGMFKRMTTDPERGQPIPYGNGTSAHLADQALQAYENLHKISRMAGIAC
jgi:plasmid maintenance system antidote protein VapI